MSLVVGIQHRGGWSIAADSYHGVNEMRVPGSPKVQQIGGWLVGTCGGGDDSYAYLRGLTGSEELDRPSFHIERMKWWREQCRSMGDDPTKPIEPDLLMLWAKEHSCFAVNAPSGQLCPAHRYVAIGCGQAMALLLLHESMGFEGELPDRETAAEVATDVITRVAAVDTRIALPVCCWSVGEPNYEWRTVGRDRGYVPPLR